MRRDTPAPTTDEATAFPETDTVTETDSSPIVALTDKPTDSQDPVDATPPRPRRGRRPKTLATNEVEVTAASEPAETQPAVETEPPPAKPRRTRRPKVAPDIAVVEAFLAETDAVTQSDTVSELETTDASAEPTVTFEAEPLALEVPDVFADASDLLPDAVFDVAFIDDESGDPAETPEEESASPFLETVDPATDSVDLTTESVDPATDSTDAARRNRNRNRRNRDKRGQTTAAGAPAAKPTAAKTPLRKRGPRTLFRTTPLPALPPTENIAPTDIPAFVLPVNRRRGVRTLVAARRILTASGITLVSAAQAAALLGSTLVAGETVAAPVVELSIQPLPIAPRYLPLPDETLARFCEVTVAPHNGVVELSINGIPLLPVFLFVNTEVADEPEAAREIAVSQIKRAYNSGVRAFTLLAHLPWRKKSGERRFDSLDAMLALVAESAPDAFILPRLIFSPPVSWERANPEQMARFSNEETGDASLGSDLFWNGEATDALRAAIEHLAESEHAARILGVYLERGEWFQPKGLGADDSEANTAGVPCLSQNPLPKQCRRAALGMVRRRGRFRHCRDTDP